MTTIRLSLVIISLLAAGPITAADKPETPPGLKPEEVTALAKIRTVAMTPVRIDTIAGKRADVSDHCAALIEARLREAGFEVVPPAVFAEIRDRVNHDLGGIYDPMTGRLKEDRAKALTDYVRREFDEKYPHEAVAHAGIVEYAARFDGFKASWHGVEQSSVGPDAGFWKRFNSGAGDKYGRMPALSLAVVIRDTDDKAVYTGIGGIELASRVGKSIERLPPAALLADPAKIDNAAQLAFAALASATAQMREARNGAPPAPVGAAPAESADTRISP